MCLCSRTVNLTICPWCAFLNEKKEREKEEEENEGRTDRQEEGREGKGNREMRVGMQRKWETRMKKSREGREGTPIHQLLSLEDRISKAQRRKTHNNHTHSKKRLAFVVSSFLSLCLCACLWLGTYEMERVLGAQPFIFLSNKKMACFLFVIKTFRALPARAVSVFRPPICSISTPPFQTKAWPMH